MNMDKNSSARLPHFTWWDWFLTLGYLSVTVTVSLLQGSFSPLSFTAGILSILCIIFGCKGHSLNFLFGLLGSGIQGYMALKSGLYANAVLFLLYNVPMQFVGYANWKKRHLDSNAGGLQTRWMTWTQRLLLAAGSVALVYCVSILLSKTNDPQPVSDAMAVTAAIGAQLLLTLAFVEQWLMWLIVNAAQLAMWSIAISRGVQYAPIMVIQYSFFMANSIYGIVLWSRMSKNQ